MKPHDFVKKCAGVCLILVALAGCRAGAPIYDVKDSAIPISTDRPLSLNEVTRAITTAAAKHGWEMRVEKPGL
ncbi:MAG TPA: hypothetical protein VLS44_11645, partial [Nitrospira sp.]|nr:hypothetical protein [Nitrospira sp.]